MKKIILAVSAAMASIALLVACSGLAEEGTAVNKALRSALSPSTAESTATAALSETEAMEKVKEKLDPEENYALSVADSSSVIDSKPYYVVTVSLDGNALDPAAAVDVSTGEMYCLYAKKTLSDFQEFPFMARESKPIEWSGVYSLKTDNVTAKLELTQTEGGTVQFSIENSASGIVSKIDGIAAVEGDMATYEGEENGLCFTFYWFEDSLTVTTAGSTATGAENYDGDYKPAQ